MKYTKIIIIALLLLAINSCKEENKIAQNDRAYSPETIQEEYGRSRVVGFVVDNTSKPLDGVRVFFGEHESITDAEGKFELSEVSEGSGKRIWFEKEGYARTQKLVDVHEDLPNRVDAALFQIAKTEKFTNEGGLIEDDDFSVDIQPGGFVYADGEIVEGEVIVLVTPFLTSEEYFLDAFPGDFEGTREDGSTTPIESFGFIDVDLRDEAGEPVQMADGVTATIKIKAPENAPATIPMWWYDYRKAEWIEEGTGSLDNGFYSAEVTHFTPWNWDKPFFPRSIITGRVVDSLGNPIEGASLIQKSKNRTFYEFTKSLEDGTFEMYTLENLEVELEAQFDIYGSSKLDITTSGNQEEINNFGDIIIDISLENVIPPYIYKDILFISADYENKIHGIYFGNEKKGGYELLINKQEVETTFWTNTEIGFILQPNAPDEGTIGIKRAGSLSTTVPYKVVDYFCMIGKYLYNNEELPGIIVNASQHTTYGIDLRGEGISDLPKCIGRLNKLRYLLLNDNELTQLPDEIANLKHLGRLDASTNNLTSLPENIGNLDTLGYSYRHRGQNFNEDGVLDFSHNQIEYLPESIGNLSVHILELQTNKLTTLPENFGNMNNLIDLNLSTNQLSVLPESFGNLNSLKTLDLTNNIITTLPESIGNLNNLEFFDLQDNAISFLPESIGNLNNLESISLRNNQLTTLPESMGELEKLRGLWLKNNQINSLPEFSDYLPNLSVLELSSNQLSSLPKTIGNLSRLHKLNLNNNQLVSLPESIGNLSGLWELNLNGNQLTSLPESIGNLSNLGLLDLYGNQLANLPESFGNLSNLEELDLNDNQLSSLPESIGSLRELEILHLDKNNLISLPESFGNLYKLGWLELNNNELINLPESFGGLMNLWDLQLQDNNLTSLPESIKNLSNNLEELDLSGNPIPESEKAKIESWLPNTNITW